MKIQARRGVFETNSSSVHTITLCTDSDFEAWKNGTKIYDRYAEALIDCTAEINDARNNDAQGRYREYQYLNYDEFFNDYEALEYETYDEKMKMPSGDVVRAFGYYGHD